MSSFRAARRAVKGLLIFLLLFSSTLVSIGSYSAYSGFHGNGNCPTNPTGYIGTCDDVSPGKYSQKLGVDFPKFTSVKLSYPTGAILTNSTGDLLFNVTLNPLMLNPLSGQVGSLVSVSGTGFSLSDTTGCTITLSGTSSSLYTPPQSCTISGGNLTGSFQANAPPGVYTVTGTGNLIGDFSSYPFTILSPFLALSPSSGPVGTLVTVTGSAFFASDNPCTITGIVMSPSCLIDGAGGLSGTFTVASVAPGLYTVTVTGNTAADTATAQFQVIDTSQGTSQSINLNPSFGQAGLTLVTVSGLGFSTSDTSCTLSGRIVPGGSLPCSISGGVLNPMPSFTVGNVAPGVYTVTVIGIQKGDLATAGFLVLPPPPTIPATPISVPISIDLYIPPDFTGLAITNVWTSFSNNYNPNLISVSHQSSSDQVGPNWWKVTISSLTVTNNPGSYPVPLVGHRVFVVNRSQYIRLFQVTSPLTAGRYFFKAFINGISIGASNFPTLIVKGSRDPAYISGTLRDLGIQRNVTNAGQPIILPNGYGGQVVATGIDYLGRPASAQAFINSSARGQYTLFGVAPGTYNITAYAAGYMPAYRPTTVSVAAAQSLEGVDIFMSPSVIITGTVLSETAEHELIKWGTLLSISNSIGNPTASSTPVSRSISIKLLNLDGSVVTSVPAPYSFALYTDPNARSFDFSIQSQSFDGRIPEDYANYTSGLNSNDYLLRAYVTSYIQLDEVRVHVTNETTSTRSEIPLIRTGIFRITVHFKNSNSTGATLVDSPILQSGSLTVSAYDMRGLLRAQNTTLVTAGSTSATQELQGISNARSFGVTSLFQQNYGLPPGTYHIKATFTSSPFFSGFANLGVANLYYQTVDVLATIGLGQGVVELSFPMYKAGGIILTIYSEDDQLPPLSVPWAYPGATITIIVIPTSGLPSIYQTNTTQPASQIKFPQTRTLPLNITGLQTGSYDVIIQSLGYTQQEILHLNVVLCGDTDASVHMILNPVIDLTVAFKNEGLLSFINSTLPYVQPINHIDGTPVRIEVFDELGNFVAAKASYIPNNPASGALTRVVNFTLAGFDIYYGDPRSIWSGFYDATDGARQNAGGLFLYPWNNNQTRIFTIRMWIEGYYQLEQLQVIVQARDEGWNGIELAPAVVSVVTSVDRASRISGTVIGPDFFDRARPLSWATITLQPDNYTLSGIIDVQPGNYTTSSLDGSFQLWVPEGTYGMGVSLEGYVSYSSIVAVSSGSDTNMWIWLDSPY